MDGLRSFLGDSGYVPLEEPAVVDAKGKKKTEASSSIAPPKRKRRVVEKEKNGKSSKVSVIVYVVLFKIQFFVEVQTQTLGRRFISKPTRERI